MSQITANGIALEYETFGPRTGETILLIMGLGGQMTRWPQDLINMFVERGYRVVIFDNRDIGLSQKIDAKGPVDVMAVMAARAQGKTPEVPYNLDHMADDAAGLLDALGISRAHIVGVSMGGMIAQLIAARYPEKTLSLTSVMSSTGNPELPPAKPEALAILMARPTSNDVEELAQRAVAAAKVIGSPGYPESDAVLRAQFLADYKRSYYPEGVTRQMGAVMASGDRRVVIKRVAAPTVVLHGLDDALVPIEAGRDTAATIAGAEMREIAGMGHDLPAAIFPAFVDAVEAAAKRARVNA